MGCGKSTKAKQLAKLLACPVIDIDSVIVAEQGMSISAYFDLHGEESFRALERETLRQYPYPETCIVATGGGLPCYYDNMEWMNKNGKTVYLAMTPAQLVSRLGKREKRPLIKDMDDAQLLSFIDAKLGDRLPYYRTAQYAVDAFDLDAKNLLSMLHHTL